jgi:hypothetical protein
LTLSGADSGFSRGPALKICRLSAAVAEAGLIRAVELERPFVEAEANIRPCFDDVDDEEDNLAVSDNAWYIALDRSLSVIQCTHNGAKP